MDDWLKEKSICFIVEKLGGYFIIADTQTGQCTIYTHDRPTAFHKGFAEQIGWFAENRVIPEEREAYRRYFNMDTLLAWTKKQGGSCRTHFTFEDQSGHHMLAIVSTLMDNPANPSGMPFLFISAQDVTSVRRMEETNSRLLFYNRHDELTGLVNRSTAEKQIRRYLQEGAAIMGSTFILADIDRFKDINDRYGHLVGDEVLRFASNCMKQVFRSEDIVCRWGGDEFVIFVKGVADENVMRRRLAILQEKMGGFSNQEVYQGITFSIGAVCLHSEVALEILFKLADEALYEVKHHGRNGIAFRHIP